MPFFPFNTAAAANSNKNSPAKSHKFPSDESEELGKKISELLGEFNEQKGKIDELDDPLSIFDSYHSQLCQLIQRTPDSSKTSSTILVPILDSATQTFAHDPRYKNDPRYLKLWLAYAKYCREAEDIFVFLAQEGIAQELATYYEEYANLLIEKTNFKQA